jgi:hypothetical protein
MHIPAKRKGITVLFLPILQVEFILWIFQYVFGSKSGAGKHWIRICFPQSKDPDPQTCIYSRYGYRNSYFLNCV